MGTVVDLMTGPAETTIALTTPGTGTVKIKCFHQLLRNNAYLMRGIQFVCEFVFASYMTDRFIIVAEFQ